VAAALDGLVRSLGIRTTLSHYDVLTSWEAIVGEQVAKVARPQRIQGGVLFVEVATAPWRTELSMRRQEIIERINTAVGAGIVKDIRFR
jgi:predicted nucleic acid-binding Zn ribbon protein